MLRVAKFALIASLSCFSILALPALLPMSKDSAVHAQAICYVGEKVHVLWNGKYYLATVLKIAPGGCYVSYDGYSNEWDEWVGADRIYGKMP